MATHNQVQIGETNGGDFSASESLPILSGRSTACTASVKRRRERLASWDDSIPHSKRYEHSTTDFQTLVHLLKGNIGTGLLALPLAVRRAGVVVGGLGLLLLGIIASHCMILLLYSSRKICKLREKDSLDYAQTAEETVEYFLEQKNILQRQRRFLKKLSGILVNFFLILTQFGFCCVYLVFIGVNVQQVLEEVYGVSLSKEAVIAIFVPLVMVASWIRNLDELASFSTIANVCIVFSLLVILYDEVEKFISDKPAIKAAVKKDGEIQFAIYKTLPLFFGGVAFAFEGIGVVLPLENKMARPQNAVRVVSVGMTIVVLLYISFGVLGYLAYGSVIEASITLNLSSDNTVEKIFFYLAKLYYAYAIFAGYLIQFYVPMDFLETPLYSGLRLHTLEYRYPRLGRRAFFAFQTVFRVLVVAITAGIAVGIPDLGDLISLIGAFACCALAFIIPPCLDLLTLLLQSPTTWSKLLLIVKDIAIIVMGVLGFIFGTYATVVNIVNYFKNHS